MQRAPVGGTIKHVCSGSRCLTSSVLILLVCVSAGCGGVTFGQMNGGGWTMYDPEDDRVPVPLFGMVRGLQCSI